MLFRLKDGVGPHLVGKKLVSAGSKVESDFNLVKLFPDKFILLEGEPSAKAKEPVLPKKYRAVPEGDGYNVINIATGQKVNDAPVSKAEARALMKD